MPLTIHVHVAPRAAIVAGRTNVGAQSFSLNDEALAALPEELRVELAIAYESGDVLGAHAHEPPVIEASLAAIQPVLAYRASQRGRLEEARRVEAARTAEIAAVTARDLTAKDNARSKALRTWIERNGDDEQRARMAEGFLREEEILEAVTDELLDVPGYSTYLPLRRGEACDCGCAHRVVFTRVSPPPYMDAFQFAKLQAVRDNAPEGAAVVPVEHKAHCPDCKCAPLARISVLVTLPWNGWGLVREFALT